MSTVDFVKDTGDGENEIPICKILVGKNLIKIILLKLKKYYLKWREHDKCRKGYSLWGWSFKKELQSGEHVIALCVSEKT